MGRNNNGMYLVGGQEYPAVTKVLALKDKSGPLMGWAVKMAVEKAEREFNAIIKSGHQITLSDVEIVLKSSKKAYREKQDTALDIGSKTHNAIEVFTKASSPIEGLKLVQALSEYGEIEKPFGAFLKWHNEVSFKLIKGEHQVYSKKYRFAGTLDAIARVRGQNTLVDYKSSTSMRDEYLWQISSYDVGYREMPLSIILENWGCLRLDKVTGEPEWKEWGTVDLADAFNKFECLLKLWWLENKKEG